MACSLSLEWLLAKNGLFSWNEFHLFFIPNVYSCSSASSRKRPNTLTPLWPFVMRTMTDTFFASPVWALTRTSTEFGVAGAKNGSIYKIKTNNLAKENVLHNKAIEHWNVSRLPSQRSGIPVQRYLLPLTITFKIIKLTGFQDMYRQCSLYCGRQEMVSFTVRIQPSFLVPHHSQADCI